MVSLTLHATSTNIIFFMLKVYTSIGPIQIQEGAWDEFSGRYKHVQAAGGLIQSTTGELLFIYRHNRWDLPKGKQEPGESIEQTAIREVQEECGVPTPELGKLLCETYHTYKVKDQNFLKKTSWFSMTLSETQMFNLQLKPQNEEGIEKVAWIPLSQAREIAYTSYGTIVDVLGSFLGSDTCEGKNSDTSPL